MNATVLTGNRLFPMIGAMIENQLSRAYLESLSTEELLAVADKIGLDIPLDLNRTFIIQEILDAHAELLNVESYDLQEESADTFERKKNKPSSAIYNSTYIDVLLRDPVWAFVFWHIREQDRRTYEASHDFNGYFLRVSSCVPGKTTEGESFSIDVDIQDGSWYICFPAPQGWFTVELFVKKGRQHILLATSRPFRIPRTVRFSPLELEQHPLGPVLLLSGIEQMRIVYAKEYSPGQYSGCN